MLRTVPVGTEDDVFQNNVAAGFELLSREPEQRKSVGQQGDGHGGYMCLSVCVCVGGWVREYE